MELKAKRITKTAKLPTKAHNTDACFDIYNDELYPVYIAPKCSAVFHTGIATEIPEGYFCPVFSRSGMGFKRGLRLANSVGIIDADYRGEWLVKLVNDSENIQRVEPGDKIAQFTLLPVLDCSIVDVEQLSDTSRGDGGFGSSGR